MATKESEPRTEKSSEAAEENTLTDQWGQERPWDPERYPEGSAAKEGKITRPSGQGGMTPKSRPDHQDMFPANPEPSETSKEKAAEDEAVARGEMSPVNAGRKPGEPPEKTKTTKTTKPSPDERRTS